MLLHTRFMGDRVVNLGYELESWTQDTQKQGSSCQWTAMWKADAVFYLSCNNLLPTEHGYSTLLFNQANHNQNTYLMFPKAAVSKAIKKIRKYSFLSD